MKLSSKRKKKNFKKFVNMFEIYSFYIKFWSGNIEKEENIELLYLFSIVMNIFRSQLRNYITFNLINRISFAY